MNKIRNIQAKLLTFLTILTILTTSLDFFPHKVEARTQTTTASKCVLEMMRMDWNRNCSLVKFDSRLGKLKTVKLSAKANTENIWLVENLNITPQNIRLSIEDTQVILKGPTNTTNLMIIDLPLINKTVNFAANDGNNDHNGIAGNSYDGITPNIDDNNAIYPKLTAEKISSQDLIDADSLATFLGSSAGEIIIIPVVANNLSGCRSSGNVSCIIETFASSEISVVYEYESPNVSVSFDNLPVIAVPGVDFIFNLQVKNIETSPTPSGVRATLTLPNGTTFDPSSFVFADWTATLTGNVVTFVRTNPMAANLTEKLPIKLTITNSAPNNIPLIAKVIITETDYDLTNNDKTANVPKNLPPILSTISPFSVVNNNTIFKLPTSILGAIDPNTIENDFVQSFTLTRLPNSLNGELFLDQLGTIPVTLNQILTTEQANNLYFKPKSGFIGNVSFEFSALDTFEAKNPPITTNFNLTNSQSGTGQYYGTNTGTIALSNNSDSNQNSQNTTNSANSQANSQNIINNSANNSQFTANSNSQNINNENTNNSNQTNQDQNLPKKVIFKLINNQLVDQNGEKINSNNEILIEENGEINKDKINQIIQNYLKNQAQNKIENENRNNKEVLINQNIQEIFIEQNGKILGKITTNDKSSNNSNQVVVVFETKNETENSQNETDSNYTGKIQNLVRTGALENLGQIGIGILAILSAVGLLWTYFAKLGKGKNENKI